ncbi:SusC/RagA family TonB-linked outer membrane protein [Pedobacter sp. HMF7647]|uniref:SusC/RagA family TonB-linked outer membrane protein n=1 Tax=Hufsiella arboris TaxID=2695275 RepID=A0A7K1YCR4_9SPHI|nr:TonB-dependent receptor [Hufsiella arboris]MXV51889.1 SusC/RagA family TonB-linked outer membrane protein [Hufsiella arboris]
MQNIGKAGTLSFPALRVITQNKTGKTLKMLVSLFLTSLIYSSAFSQTTRPLINSTLRGRVIDSRTKSPLGGVLVHIKGTTHEVATDDQGQFNFVTGQKFPYTLIVSLIGYKKEELVVSESTVEIQLEESVNLLNDVVIVGYGTQRKSDVTGSVSSVPRENLNQVSPSVDNLLRGAAPGVQVTQSSGQPGASASIRIRGGNSITGGNEPLYVIDGFPIYNDNGNTSTGAGSGAGTNALSTINPSDIESIDILKDASATAIYGSRGANGVVLITTKKGRRGSNSVSYQGYYGTQKLSDKIDLLNGSQWASLRNDILASTNQPASFTPDQIAAIGNGTDWQSAAFHTSPVQNHELSFAGGDDKSRFAVSGNYFSQDGIVKNTDFTRYAGRFNYERDFSDKFKFGINSTGSYSTSQGAATNSSSTSLSSPNAITNVIVTSPVISLYNADGTFNLNNPYMTTPGNPVYDLDLVTNQTNITRILGNAFGEYKFTRDFSAKVSVGADLIGAKQNYYAPSNSSNGYLLLGSAAVGSRQTNSWLNENTVNYNHSFNDKHTLSVLAGYTTQHSKSENVLAGSKNFVTDQTTYNNLQSGAQINTPSSGTYEWSLNSFLARINYSFLHRYNFTFSGRADGSSRFSKGNYWGYFPSVGLSWNAGDEKFIKNIDAISNLKIRFSVGSTGNQEIGYYQALAPLNAVTYNFASLTTGFAPASLSNPNLKWEKTLQYNAGIDLGLFDSRISLVADAYYKKTTDLLLNVPIPISSGFATSLQNVGSVENKGFELGINSDNLGKSQFTWKTSLVYSLNRNKVLSLGENVKSFFANINNSTVNLLQPVNIIVGQPLGTFWGYRTNGIFQLGDEMSKLPKIKASDTFGDRRYVDTNNDGAITAADKVSLGSVQPKFSGSLSNTFGYKNFDLLVFIQGSYGNEIYNAFKQQLEITNLVQNSTADIANRWTPTNPSNEIPRATNSPVAQMSNRYVEDGSYLRLKTLTLGYTFKNELISKIKAKQLRLFVTAQNLATWTKYTGYDPEVSSFEQSNTAQGIDYGAYPNYRTFLAGLNVSF